MKYFAIRVFVRFFAQRFDRALAWAEYDMGLTGTGTSALDRKPEYARPWVPGFVRRAIEEWADDEARWRRHCWRKSVMDVTGEDPDDWRLAP